MAAQTGVRWRHGLGYGGGTDWGTVAAQTEVRWRHRLGYDGGMDWTLTYNGASERSGEKTVFFVLVPGVSRYEEFTVLRIIF